MTPLDMGVSRGGTGPRPSKKFFLKNNFSFKKFSDTFPEFSFLSLSFMHHLSTKTNFGPPLKKFLGTHLIFEKKIPKHFLNFVVHTKEFQNTPLEKLLATPLFRIDK